MPTYQYACTKCGHEFELFQSMKDTAIDVCPKDKCGMQRWGKGKVRRELGTGAGLIFKGSGFYITDYRSESYKNAAKKEKEAAGGPAKTSEKSGGSGSGGESRSASSPSAGKKDASG